MLRSGATCTLASASPQRRRILADLGVDFTVQATDVDELTAGDRIEVAVANAIAKVRAATADSDIVIGCDTVVSTEHGLWGKPADESDARRTLEHLSGRTHAVTSGLAVSRRGEVTTATETTAVTFRLLSADDVDRYLATDEWQGRAGGYAIQSAGVSLVTRVEGDLSNVIGLPVTALLRLAPEIVCGTI